MYQLFNLPDYGTYIPVDSQVVVVGMADRHFAVFGCLRRNKGSCAPSILGHGLQAHALRILSRRRLWRTDLSRTNKVKNFIHCPPSKNFIPAVLLFSQRGYGISNQDSRQHLIQTEPEYYGCSPSYQKFFAGRGRGWPAAFLVSGLGKPLYTRFFHTESFRRSPVGPVNSK